LNTDGDTEIRMGDLPLVGGEGEPLLPVRSVMVPIPDGYEVTGVDVQFHSVEPMGPIRSPALSMELPISEPVSSYGDALNTPRVAYPLERVRLEGVHTLDGERFAIVNIFPVSLDISSGTVLTAGSGTLTVAAAATGCGISEATEVVTGDGQAPTSDVEYLIITSADLELSFQALMEWKTDRGNFSRELTNITAEIVTIDEIASDPLYWGDPSTHSGTGNDTQTQVRNLIIDYYHNHDTSYVLLGGDVEIVPCRKVRVIASISSEIPADVYYSGLDGTWDLDDDGVYGEGAGSGGGSEGEEADLLLEMSVGRATVDTPQEAGKFVSKVIAYERTLSDPTLNTSLLVGEKLDYTTWGGDYKDEVRSLTFPVSDPEIDVQTLYERDGTFSASAFIDAMNSGVHLINHMGHGDYDGFADLQTSMISSLENEQYFIMFSQACFVGGFDHPNEDSIAEEFISSEHGAVATLVNSRQGWYSPGSTDGSSQQYDIEFFDALFHEGIDALGDALLDAKSDLTPEVWSTGSMRWCFMTLNLLGDPEMGVHFLMERDHDVAVLEVDHDQAFQGEVCSVTATVANLGAQYESQVPVELLVGGEVMSSDMVDIDINGTAEANLAWTPADHGTIGIEVRTNLSGDGFPSNDALDCLVEIGWRIAGTEVISDEVLGLDTFLVIEEGATLWIGNSTVYLNSTSTDPLVAMGCMEVVNSTLVLNTQGNELLFGINSTLSILGSELESPVPTSLIVEGELTVNDSSLGRIGIRIVNGSGTMSNSSIEGSDVGVDARGSCVSLHHLTISNSTVGVSLQNTTGAALNVTVTNCTAGIIIDECTGLLVDGCRVTGCEVGVTVSSCIELRFINNTIVNNLRDISFNGTEVAHFELEVSGNAVTMGEVVFIIDQFDVQMSLADPPGYLALVSSGNCTITGMDLQGNGEGILIANSTDILVEGCHLHNSTVGARVVSCVNCTLLENDLTSNQRDLIADCEIRLNGSHEEGGNYWSSYSGTDEMSGPDQDQPGADGLGDTPFQVPGTGCVDWYPVMRPITVPNAPPLAMFEYSPLHPLTYHTVRFEDLSSDLDGEVINWTWDLGDGTVVYMNEPSHSYSQGGNYTVTMLVMDDSRQWSNCSLQITVENQTPSADFSFSPGFPDVGEVVSFTDLSSDGDGHLVSWHWDLGDGNSSSEADPGHAYLLKGSYAVTLTVWDDDGLTDARSRTVWVGNEPPSVNFSFSPFTPLTGEEVAFLDLSIDPDGSIVGRTWDFGDGGTSTQANPVHVYADDGSYVVNLTVEDDSGQSIASQKTLQITNRAPAVDFSLSGDALYSGDMVQVNDLSVDADGEVVAWLWDFGDGSTSDVQSPEHSYSFPGDYEITLTVWDDDGMNSSLTRAIQIVNLGPVAGFNWSIDLLDPLTVILESTSYDPDGGEISNNWDFGDGTVSTEIDPVHAFAAEGNYTVSLTAIDENEDTSQVQKQIWIRLPDLTVEVQLPQEILPGEEAWVTASVVNNGSLGVEETTISLLVDGLVQDSSTFSIESGEEITFELGWIPTVGNHTISVQVDREGEVVESDEENNQFSFDLFVGSGIGADDGLPQNWLLIMGILAILGAGAAVVIGLRSRSR